MDLPTAHRGDGPTDGDGGKLADGSGVRRDRDDDEHEDGGEKDFDPESLEWTPRRHGRPEACLGADELLEHPGSAHGAQKVANQGSWI